MVRAVAVGVVVVALAACGGGAPSAPPPPSGPIVFSSTPGLVCCPPAFTLTIAVDGTATKTASGQSSTAHLSPGLTSQIFADANAALPLSALPASNMADAGSVTVTWRAQSSPNITPPVNSIESALIADFNNVLAAFGH